MVFLAVLKIYSKAIQWRDQKVRPKSAAELVKNLPDQHYLSRKEKKKSLLEFFISIDWFK